MNISAFATDRDDGVTEATYLPAFGILKSKMDAVPTIISGNYGYLLAPGTLRGSLPDVLVNDVTVTSTITVGCFQALKAKLKMWFSKSASGAPTEKTPIITYDPHRPRFSTSLTWGEDDSRWGTFASESELRGFSDCRDESLTE
jgi:hypothetical protein